MPKAVIFSRSGIELALSFEGENQVIILSISEEDKRLVKQLSIEDISVLQESASRLLEYNRALDGELGLGANSPGNISRAARQAIIAALLSSVTATNISERWADLLRATSTTYHHTEAIGAEVFIGLPQEDINIFTVERILNATGDFMEAMGFELETQDEPVYGSFFQRLKFLLKGEVKQEVNEIYSKGKTALEAQFIDLPSAEATSKLATSAAELITALTPVSDAAIRCGSILLVKVTKDGVPKIITETISLELAALLNKNPALLQNPSIVFDLISGMRAPDRTIEESGSAELAE